MNVSVHRGSVLSLLLLIIMLETFSREFRTGVLWEDLYADDLVIIAESLKACEDPDQSGQMYVVCLCNPNT